jgi:Fe-S-cluster containining protein
MITTLFSVNTAAQNYSFPTRIRFMTENITRKACNRCGTCCIKGGPALHHKDRELLQNNMLRLEHLITIRKGEPVFSLAAETPEPAQSEIIKIKGRGTEWTCFFFQENSTKCDIYEHRPLECSLLKCWETADLEKIAGRHLLSRYDIIEPHDPILPFIKAHDDKCSLENLTPVLSEVNSKDSQQEALHILTRLVNTDLALRSQACMRFHFSLDLELFFFGRPFFKILNQFGINMHEENGVCSLSLASSSSSEMQVNP